MNSEQSFSLFILKSIRGLFQKFNTNKHIFLISSKFSIFNLGIALLIVLAGLLLNSISKYAVAEENPSILLTSGDSTPDVILSGQGLIEQWQVGAGFIYWFDDCTFGPTSAYLNRRAINGGIIQNLISIDDPNECETLIGAAVDDSGFYYYNRSDGTIEAIYSDTPANSPTILATVGVLADIGFGHAISSIFLDDSHVYWIEVIPQPGEFDPDEIKILRVNKIGSEPSTLLTYENIHAGYGMVITDNYLFWTDFNGLNRLGKPGCTTSCGHTIIHANSMRKGRMTTNEADDIIWWDFDPLAGQNSEILHTSCLSGLSCTTQTRYSAPESITIYAIAANAQDIFWLESDGPRLLRMPVTGGASSICYENDLSLWQVLGIDTQGVYFKNGDSQQILRLPTDCDPIVREISFEGWEITQAIQNVETNDVPLVASKSTFVRVYASLDSGSSSSSVEALLYGWRDGIPLPGSPLNPINGKVPVDQANPLTMRYDIDLGWLFELPLSWTRHTETSIPLENADLTLRIEIDPRGLTGDTTPGDLVHEDTFTFIAKAPTCVHLRSINSIGPYQSPNDTSVGQTIELAKAAHPTPKLVKTYDNNSISAIRWCWKWYGYGPWCHGPYDLNGTTLGIENSSWLLAKMYFLQIPHSNPSVCYQTGARTLYGGVLSIDDPWDSEGKASVGEDAFITKILPYWDWTERNNGLTNYTAMTFVHEIGHNYSRKHVDCGNPSGVGSYDYDPDKIDDGALDLTSTHYGFNTMFLSVLRPDTNKDYMSYCDPRWVSDYTWERISNKTGPPEPIYPLSSDLSISSRTLEVPSYIFVSGRVEVSPLQGAIDALLNYPSTEAGPGLIGQWENSAAIPWTDETHHLRLISNEGSTISDWAIVLTESSDPGPKDGFFFQAVIPAPANPVSGVQLMADELVLAEIITSTSEPIVSIIYPQGGETVDGEVTLQWTANDADNPDWLLYTIQYSADMGEHWYSIDTNRPGPGQGIVESLVLDLSGLPGSEGQDAILRVLASDGYQTGLDTSQPFNVARREPEVFITAPSEGDWYAAGEPINFRGDASDPEDILIEPDVFSWDLDGMTLDNDRGILAGLAPGTHTLTLEVSDSDGQMGSDSVYFEVDALQIPLVTDLALDGHCNDMGYDEKELPLLSNGEGGQATAFTARTAEHLWVCLQGLIGSDGFAGLQVDIDNSQDALVQPGDLGFFVKLDGTPLMMEGDGNMFVAIQPSGMSSRISGDSTGWSAELRIDANKVGGWDNRVAIGIGHYGSETGVVWPINESLEQPQSWAQTNLVSGENLILQEISPISTVLGSQVELTINGANFLPDSIVLWNGFQLSTTYVDSGILTALVPSSLTGNVGFQTVRVAPSTAPEVSSNPLLFTVLYPQPTINSINPSSAVWNDPGFTLTVNVIGFVPDTTGLWNGESRPTKFISSTQLEVTISEEDLEDAWTVSIMVTNPIPNAGSSDSVDFEIKVSENLIYLPVLFK